MPHYSDYCNTCNEFRIQIKAERRKVFHLISSSEADPERLQSLNNSIEELIKKCSEHRDLAFKEQDYYKKIKNSCKEELERIEAMEVIDEKKAEELKKLQPLF